MSLEQASKELPFEISAKIFQLCQQFCEDTGGEEAKHRFISRFCNHVVPKFFRQIIFGTGYHNIGPIESKEELNSILLEFERTFGKWCKTPSLEEIKKSCIRSEKFEEYRDKIERIFG